MHSRLGVVSIHPETSAFEIEGRDFKEPGTGLLMTRPWGSRNLAVIIAGIDAQGLETAARLFPKRTGLLVPDWGKKEILGCEDRRKEGKTWMRMFAN